MHIDDPRRAQMCVAEIRRSGAAHGRTAHVGESGRVQRNVFVKRWPNGGSDETVPPQAEKISRGCRQPALEKRIIHLQYTYYFLRSCSARFGPLSCFRQFAYLRGGVCRTCFAVAT